LIFLINVAGQRCSYRRTFAEAQAGELFWYRNSNGLVEIAMNGESASGNAGLGIGDRVNKTQEGT